ncbi:MAG: histidine kinase [Lachnospiraceae bacterium]|nr:histidine kinase [Lachnospiraceae bacterium]
MLMAAALIICVVFLWVLFFLMTRSAIERNTVLQAEATSDTIIRSIEQELLSLEDTADSLSRYDRVSKMIRAENAVSFYDAGMTAGENADSIIGNYCPADNVIVYDRNGLFYRLKGKIANTALKRAFFLVNGSRKKTLTLTFNDMTFIGCSAPVTEKGEIKGYVVLLMDRTRLEALLNSFKDLEYLGAVIMAEGEAICKSSGLNEEEIKNAVDNSVFYKEKEIGLSGFNLLIYCENTLISGPEAYFRIAMPVTIGILFGILSIFIIYWNRHIVSPVNSILRVTSEGGGRPLPLTGEAYFDDLVNRVNDNLKSIEERDKELFDSGIRIKEYELERERTLIALLKKQISAHFTVNTLSAVRALINKGEKKEAARICDELSALLRYANAGEENISLLEEFHILDQYASIMQTRYPGRFSFEAEEEDSLADIYIPRMLLQPLVENAIIHGFESGMEMIRVYAEISEDVTVFVKDDGRGIEEQELKNLTEMLSDTDMLMETSLHHVALLNIQKRIRMVCGDDYGISIESREGNGTTVSLHLPAMTDPDR